jgi:peptidoglycan-N-acetylglucosamine deacetylase
MATIRVALTIDDLPLWPHGDLAAGYTPDGIADALISALHAHGIEGVYSFSNSWPLERDPSLRRVFDKWVAAGHFVANHTHSHKTSHELSAEEYIAEIDRCEAILAPWMRRGPGKYFRYTFDRWGDTADKVQRIKRHLDERGYAIGELSSWFYEWEWDKAYKAALGADDADACRFLKSSFLEFALAQLQFDTTEATRWHGRPFTGIVLGHVIPFMAEVIDPMLARFKAAGVEFVSFEEAARDPIYAGAGTFVSDRFLPHWRKVAHHQGLDLPTIAPGFEDLYARVQRMAADPDVVSPDGAPDRPFV